MPRTLVIHAVVPESHQQAVGWAWRHAALSWGIPIAVQFGLRGLPSPDVVYSPTRPPSTPKWLPYNPHCYDGGGEFLESTEVGGPAWVEAGQPDLVGGMFRLLTLADEADVSETSRNRLGVFDTLSLPDERRAGARRPYVEHHLDILWRQIEQWRPDLRRVPRWPDGKRWAVVLTHDTDAVSLGRPGALLYNAGKLVLRRERVRLGMLAAGLRHWRSPMDDPYFGFTTWRRIENDWGIKSAFYLFVKPRHVPRHVHDSRSAVTDRGIDPGLFREMADAGWEFGLHASILTRHAPHGFAESRRMLEDLLQRPVLGLRHHYWAVDWTAPWKTFRQQAEAGFVYDTSIAWRDVPGLRAATCLPYRPFDPERRTAVDLWELPTALQDGHLLQATDPEGALATAEGMLEEIRDIEGVLVLNWHTEAANSPYDRAGYREVLERLLNRVLAESDAWITTPGRLVEHWTARERLVGQIPADPPPPAEDLEH